MSAATSRVAQSAAIDVDESWKTFDASALANDATAGVARLRSGA